MTGNGWLSATGGMLQQSSLVRRADCEILALGELEAKAGEFVVRSKAEATVRAYRRDLADFRAWCEARGFTCLPAKPKVLALYLTDRAETLKVSTLNRRLCAIREAHRLAGLSVPTDDPTVTAVWAGIRRSKRVAVIEKSPLLTSQIRAIAVQMPRDLRGLRDRAMLLVGFAGALRRSELAGLDVEDVRFEPEGVIINLRRSKTDQEGQGRLLAVPFGRGPITCPVRALRAWLDAAAVTAGPIFRRIDWHAQLHDERVSARTVARIVKRYCAGVGLDADLYAGHSLRAGFATSAALSGASERSIMTQTGHKSVAMVRRYIRLGTLWEENAADLLGL